MSTQAALQQKAEAAKEAAQDAPLLVTTKAQSAFNSIKQFSLVQRYVLPPASAIRQRYVQSPRMVKVGWMVFAGMAAIPVGCFLGFMGMVTLGVLIVGGIAFTIVEGGFAMFGSVFLLPALGVSLLVACGVGLVSLVGYVCYVTACGILGIIWGGGDMRAGQQQMREAKQRAEEGGRRATS